MTVANRLLLGALAGIAGTFAMTAAARGYAPGVAASGAISFAAPGNYGRRAPCAGQAHAR
jgi:hypothetical protein